jgi:hypothetical protein
LKNQHFDYLVSRGFTGTIEDLTAVSHLDDNSINNNVSNLLNLPSAWNHNLKKPKAAKVAKRSGEQKYYQQVVIGGSIPYNTVSTQDPNEALFQYDMLKVKHCLKHMLIKFPSSEAECGDLARQVLFDHGLIRPEQFVRQGRYKDIPTLLSFYEYYESLRGSSHRKGKTHVKLDRFRLLNLNDPDVTQAIHDSLNFPGNLPFDRLLHVVFEYVGKKVKHQRICNRDFYESVVKHYTGPVYQDADGYLDFTKLGKLHNLALGRKIGDHAKDKLQGILGFILIIGCHGVGGKLDNRVTKKSDGKLDRRTLTLGSASTNASHIVRKKAGSHSNYPGVSKQGNKWRVDWRYENWSYYLGNFDTELEAANAYAHVQEHREEIAGLLAPVPKNASKSAKKSLRAANLIIVKFYIKSSLYPTVKVIRDSQ